jgi:sigma-E factor negative regulatory protein RseC
MKATARVQQVRDGRAVLACETVASACEACSGGRGCALRWLGRQGGATLEAPELGSDGTRLVPGMAVVVEVGDGEVLRSAMLAYVPPLAGLLAGASIARMVAAGDEVSAVLAAGAGLAFGWAAARVWLRRSPPRFQLRAPEAA